MAFCKACGQEVGTATFCPKCGASQGSAVAPAGTPMMASSGSEGLSENVAGLLCYVLGWITGIVFLLIDKRPWVKFQAAQSIVVFGGLTVIRIALWMMASMIGGMVGWSLFGGLILVVGLVGVILWILLMVKAYQHADFRVPIAANIADGLVKN
jgi:uncharacterized membrane protein